MLIFLLEIIPMPKKDLEIACNQILKVQPRPTPLIIWVYAAGGIRIHSITYQTKVALKLTRIFKTL